MPITKGNDRDHYLILNYIGPGPKTKGYNGQREDMLEDPKINVKLKLSALWAPLVALYLYGDYFEMYVSGKVDGLLHGNSLLDSPLRSLMTSILLAIPALTIGPSLLLRPKINRGLNLVFATLLTIVVLLEVLQFPCGTTASMFYMRS